MLDRDVLLWFSATFGSRYIFTQDRTLEQDKFDRTDARAISVNFLCQYGLCQALTLILWSL